MLRTVQHIQPIVFRSLTLSNVSKFQTNALQFRLFNNQTSPYIQSWIDTLDEAQQKRVRFIQNELTLHGLENKPVPLIEKLTKTDYEHIMALSSNQRQKYYNYLYKTHLSESTYSLKRQVRKKVTEDLKDRGMLTRKSTGHIEYGLGKGKSSLILKISNQTVDKWRNVKTQWHFQLGAPKIIFDCSYSEQMTPRENKESAKQLAYSFGLNRAHIAPFTLFFCGLNQESLLRHYLDREIPTLKTKPLPVRIRTEDVCDVFAHEKLVFLTPDAPTVLREYNPEDHYVISGLVERGNQNPLSLAKAKSLNIRAARLPLELYRTCRINKWLTLNQVLQVMLEIKRSGDWDTAFRYLPSRKFF